MTNVVLFIFVLLLSQSGFSQDLGGAYYQTNSINSAVPFAGCASIGIQYVSSLNSCNMDSEGNAVGTYSLNLEMTCPLYSGGSITSPMVLYFGCNGGTPISYNIVHPSVIDGATALDLPTFASVSTLFTNLTERDLLKIVLPPPQVPQVGTDGQYHYSAPRDDSGVLAGVTTSPNDGLKPLFPSESPDMLNPTIEFQGAETTDQCWTSVDGREFGSESVLANFTFPDGNGCHSVFGAHLKYSCEGGKSNNTIVTYGQYDHEKEPQCNGVPRSDLNGKRTFIILDLAKKKFGNIEIPPPPICHQEFEDHPELGYAVGKTVCPPFEVSSYFGQKKRSATSQKGTNEGYGYSSPIYKEGNSAFAITKIVSALSETNVAYNVELPFNTAKISVPRSFVSRSEGNEPRLKAFDVVRTTIPTGGQVFTGAQYSAVLETIKQSVASGLIQPIREPSQPGVYDCTVNTAGAPFSFVLSDVSVSKASVISQKQSRLRILCSLKMGVVTNIYPVKIQ